GVRARARHRRRGRGAERTRRAGDPPSHLASRAAATHGGRGIRGHPRGDARSRLAPRPPGARAALRLDALGPAPPPPRGRADPAVVRDLRAALTRIGRRRAGRRRTGKCPGPSPRAGAIPFPRVPDVWSPLPPQSAGPPVTRWDHYRTSPGKTAVARLVFPWTPGAGTLGQRDDQEARSRRPGGRSASDRELDPLAVGADGVRAGDRLELGVPRGPSDVSSSAGSPEGCASGSSGEDSPRGRGVRTGTGAIETNL